MPFPDDPCGHCPCPDRCLWRARRHARGCDLTDPAHPDYDPAYETIRCEPPPSLLSKVVSFAGAVATHVAAGMPIVEEAEYQRRLAICQGDGVQPKCEHYDPEKRACLQCGCSGYLLIHEKIRWADQACPIGKW
jgi:hypothetical protein